MVRFAIQYYSDSSETTIIGTASTGPIENGSITTPPPGMVLGYWIVGSGTTNPDYTIGDIVNIGAGFVVPPPVIYLNLYPFYTTSSGGVSCFMEGTQISCYLDDKECLVPIEQLEKGMLVKTVKHGYKMIDSVGMSRIYNPANQLRGKDRLYRCPQEKYPELTEDLYMTGSHAILVKNLTPQQKQESIELFQKVYMTDGHYRLMTCMDKRAEPLEEEGLFNIWHLALESDDQYINYGVYANGLLVETMCKWVMHKRSGMTIKD